jgi:NNP family nitrate/nitrite transporter-like MFS transporter
MNRILSPRDKAHPSRTNANVLAVIFVLVLIVTMQIWLLTAALNADLGGDATLKWPAFWASTALFIGGSALLRYLPGARHMPSKSTESIPFEDPTEIAIRKRTLLISAPALALAFAVWFMWSAIPLKLNDVGFHLSRQQLFWLSATPVILGSLLRIPYGMFVSRFGSRRSFAAVTLALIVPCVFTGIVVTDPTIPFGVLLSASALSGIAGANFATSMAVVSLWFPKRMQGTALGINGLGNFGVTIAQLTVPAIIMLGPVSWINGSRVTAPFLGNAAYIWVLPTLLLTAAIWFGTKDKHVPVQSLGSQLVAGKRRDTWILSTLYFLTFGCFVAMGASLPLVIKEVFRNAPGGAPVPLHYAPWAAAIATIMRPIGGSLADRFGGGRVTAYAIAVMGLGGLSLSAYPQPEHFARFFALILVVCGAAGIGNGSIFKMIPRLLPGPEAAAGIGIVSCLGAIGGFIPPLILGWTLDHRGTPGPAYATMAGFAAVCFAINAWFYVRKSSPSHC